MFQNSINIRFLKVERGSESFPFNFFFIKTRKPAGYCALRLNHFSENPLSSVFNHNARISQTAKETI